jgi:hypothetical protein
MILPFVGANFVHVDGLEEHSRQVTASPSRAPRSYDLLPDTFGIQRNVGMSVGTSILKSCTSGNKLSRGEAEEWGYWARWVDDYAIFFGFGYCCLYAGLISQVRGEARKWAKWWGEATCEVTIMESLRYKEFCRLF